MAKHVPSAFNMISSLIQLMLDVRVSDFRDADQELVQDPSLWLLYNFHPTEVLCVKPLMEAPAIVALSHASSGCTHLNPKFHAWSHRRS